MDKKKFVQKCWKRFVLLGRRGEKSYVDKNTFKVWITEMECFFHIFSS